MYEQLKRTVSYIILKHFLQAEQVFEYPQHIEISVKKEFHDFLVSEGIGPIMYNVLFRSLTQDSRLPTPDSRLKDSYMRTAIRNTLLFSEFAEIASGTGIPLIPLKGTYLAMKFYDNPNLRPMQDIDILVRRQDIPAMETLLREHGYERLEEPIVPDSFKRETGNGKRKTVYWPAAGNSINSIYFRKYVDGNKFLFSDVHVHWHWINASYYMDFEKIDMDEVWKTAREVEWQNGIKIHAVPDELLLLHMAEHNLKHNFRKMVKLLDVAVVLKKGSIKWDEVERYARQFNLIKPLLYTLVFTEDAFPGTVPEGVIRRFSRGPKTHLEVQFESMIKNGVRRTGMNWLVYQAMCGGGLGRLRTAARLAASLFCREGGLHRIAGTIKFLGK